MIPAAGHLGIVLAASGNHAEVEGLFREALGSIPHPTASDRKGILNLRANFAYAKLSWGEFRAAADEYRAVLSKYQSMEDANGEAAMIYANIAICDRALNDLPAAEAELRTASQMAATHPIGSEARSLKIPLGLALTLAMEGKTDEAESLLKEVSPRLEKFSAGNTNLEGFSEMVWGVAALKRGHAAAAEHRFRRSAEVYERALQPTDASLAQIRRLLASALEAQGKTAEARAAAQEAVRIYALNYAAGNPILEDARTYSQNLLK
jgi:tetratricopeptide (TPR) repeat protein